MALQTLLGLATIILLLLIFLVLVKLMLRCKERGTELQEIRVENPNLPGDSITSTLPTTVTSPSHTSRLASGYLTGDFAIDGSYSGVRALFMVRGGTSFDGEDDPYAHNLVVVGNDFFGITFGDLLKANLVPLGKGKSVYMCELKSNLILKHLKSVTLSLSEFGDLINRLGAMDHSNLLPIRAYCYDEYYKFILYEQSSKGSLFNLLHGEISGGPLHIKDILTVSLGVAMGIKHLHDHDISHGNLRSSNVIVIHGMHVRLSAFGLNSTHNDGSRMNDVYNFGVLLLELLTRKNPNRDILYESEYIHLVPWVKKMIMKCDVSFLDVLRSPQEEKQIDDLLVLALKCLTKNCTMFEVIVQLQKTGGVSQ